MKFRFLLMNLLVLSLALLYGCAEDDFATSERYQSAKEPSLSANEKIITIGGQRLHVLDEDSVYVFQGDVRIDKRLIEEEALRGAVNIGTRWPSNTIYYDLKNFPDYPSPMLTKVLDAFREIENKTYVKFKKFLKGEGQNRYLEIRFIPGERDYASSNYIGFHPISQNILELPENMLAHSSGVGVVVHEICHALGMYHEQCRADRDQYINIDWSNTSSPYQFRTYLDRGDSGKDVGVFDFQSIMLYESYATAVDINKPVMTKKDGSVFWAQRSRLSEGDAQSLIYLYPPKKFCFEEGLGSPDSYQDLGIEQIRQETLKCKGETEIRFKLSYNFYPEIARLNLLRGLRSDLDLDIDYEPPLLTVLSFKDFDLRLAFEIENVQGYNKKQIQEVPLTRVIKSWETRDWSVVLPVGVYKCRIHLYGMLTDSGIKKQGGYEAFKKLANAVTAQFSIEEVRINNESVYVPKQFKDPERIHTLIQL